MKKRLLSLVLALVMIIGLIPLYPKAATTSTMNVKLMANTEYELVLTSEKGAPVYAKNKQVTFTDTGKNTFTGWVQEPVTVNDEATDEWNVKFYYDDNASRWSMILKGAKMDAYNDDTSLIVKDAVPIVGFGSSGYGYEMRMIVEEDSYLEGKYMISGYGTSTRWSSLTINGENNATIYGKTAGYGIYTQRSIYLNVNIYCVCPSVNTFAYINTTDGTRYFRINGGNYNIHAYQLVNSKTHATQLFGGNITLTGATKFASYGSIAFKDDACHQFTDLDGNPVALADLPVNGGAKFVTYEGHTLVDCVAGGACTICGATVAARAAHEAEADDGDVQFLHICSPFILRPGRILGTL